MGASGGGKYHPGFRFTRVGREMNSIGGLAGVDCLTPWFILLGSGLGLWFWALSGLGWFGLFVWINNKGPDWFWC